MGNSGFKKLDDLAKNLKKISETHEYSFTEVFSDKFMRRNTNFQNLDQFAEASGFDWSSHESFEQIPDDDMDKFVSANTKFSSWKEMLTSAGEQMFAQKLGF